MNQGVLTPLMLGLVGGFGVWLLLKGARPQPKPLRLLLAELDQPYIPQQATGFDSVFGSVFSSVLASVSGTVTRKMRQDLAVLDRTLADHTKAKLQNSLAFAVFPVAAYVAFTIGSGLFVSPAFLGIGIVGFAGVGWVVTDRVTHQRADARRDQIRSTLVTYLQLVSTMLAGGAGPNEALLAVTRFGSGPGFSEITQALTEARLRGVTPWRVFAEVAERKGLIEFDELASAVELAGSSGARVRTSLLTKATSMRRAELAQVQADAAAASESMGVPVGIMMLSFVIAIGFPAFMAILSI